MTNVALVVVIALAFAVEGALGFGATLVAVTLGAFLVPVDALLPAFVPLNAVLSASIVARSRRAVDVRLLLRVVLPAMALGMPFGMWAARSLDAELLVKVFGAFVIVIAAFELARRSLPLPSPLLLVLGGLVHGAFGTGGPMAVVVVGREVEDKSAFRATLSALWLLLNGALLAGWFFDGKLHAESATLTSLLAIGLVAGMIVGEVLHRTVPATLFRRVVWLGLLAAGTVLLAR